MAAPLTVTRANRVAQIAMDPERIARNAENVRRACRQYIDDGSERSVKPIRPKPRKR